MKRLRVIVTGLASVALVAAVIGSTLGARSASETAEERSGPPADAYETVDLSSAALVCRGDGTTHVRQQTLAASAGGVAVTIGSERDDSVLFIVPASSVPSDTISAGLARGIQTLDLILPPGETRVGCFTTPFDSGAVDVGSLVTVSVEDPGRQWVSPDLHCQETTETEIGIRFNQESRSGDETTLETKVRDSIPGLLASDVLKEALYPNASHSLVDAMIVVRDGQTVAVVTTPAAGGPPTFFGPFTVTACAGSGIGVV